MSTTLTKIGEFETMRFGQYITYLIPSIFLPIIAWLINAYFKLNNFQGIKNEVKTVLGISINVFVCIILSYTYSWIMPNDMLLKEMVLQLTFLGFFKHLIGLFILVMICFAFFNTIYTNGILQETRFENEHLKQAHLRAQLLSLQQQISPHYLFNSLSTLKTITKERETKEFIIQLSKVYRYLLSISEKQTTLLYQELDFINSYNYILNQRFDSALEIDIDIPEKFRNYLMPPLSIQLLIENAIKHNTFSTDLPLQIDIYINEQQDLIVKNTYQPKKTPVESTKLGLQNINDRFRLLFNQQIDVNQTDDFFTVTLPLNKYECNHH